MTLSEQAAILLEFDAIKALQSHEIVRWAKAVIATTDKPPCWLMELSILQSPNRQDFISRLEEQAATELPMRRRIQVIILAHRAGVLPLLATLSKLFEITIFETGNQRLDPLEEKLAQALVYWDCEDNPDVINPILDARFADLFVEYMSDSENIAALSPWK